MEGKRMSYFLGVFLVLLSVFNSIHSERDWNLEEDRSGWIDPHSMFDNHDSRKTADLEKFSDGTCEKSKCDCTIAEEDFKKCSGKIEGLEKDLENQIKLFRKSQTVADKEKPFFEQFIHHILNNFDKFKDKANVGHYEADVVISSLGYEYLSNYVTEQNVSIQQIHSILSKMITNTRWIKEDDDLGDLKDGLYFFSNSTVLFCLNVAALVMVAVAVSLHIVKLLQNIRIPLTLLVFRIFFVLIVTLFIVSIFWTWWHLYKKAVAKQMAATATGPPDCANQMKGFWNMFSSMFYIKNDECQRYFELLEIHPLLEVPPTQAIAVTLSRFFLEPFGHFGKAIRELMVSAFEGLPFYLWLPVYAFILLVLILVLFCFCRYRIALPFISIEPSNSGGAELARLQHRVMELEDKNKELQQSSRPGLQIKDSDGRGDEMGLRLSEAPIISPITLNQTEERQQGSLVAIPEPSFVEAELCSAE